MRLGRKPFIAKEKDFKYAKYRAVGTAPSAVPIPFGPGATIDDWDMLGNDRYGNCVFAGTAHAVMLWTAEGRKPATFDTKSVNSDYSAVTGFNPEDPSTDNGTYIRDALDYGRKVGYVDAKGVKHKIGAFLLLDRFTLSDVLEATYLFSAVSLGINVTQAAMDQFYAGQPWTVVEGTYVIGGHHVELIAFDGTWLTVVTWGKEQKMSIEFFARYCAEAWLKLSEEFLFNGLSPDGFDLAKLQADILALTPTPHNYQLSTGFENLQVPIGTEVNIRVGVLDNNNPMTAQEVAVQCSGVVRSDNVIVTDAHGVCDFTTTCNVPGEEYCSFRWVAPPGTSHYKTCVINYGGDEVKSYPYKGRFKIKYPFGVRDDGYASGYHCGVDLTGLDDLTIVPINNGPVVAITSDDAYGNRVVQKLPDGKYAYYNHLGKVLVKVGDNLQSGITPIGAEGATGNVTGPHLDIRISKYPYHTNNLVDFYSVPDYLGFPNKDELIIDKEGDDIMEVAIVFWSWDDASGVKQIADRLANCGMFCRNRVATAIHPDAQNAKRLIVVGGAEVANHPNVTNLCGLTGPDTLIKAAQFAKTL